MRSKSSFTSQVKEELVNLPDELLEYINPYLNESDEVMK